MFIDKLYDHLQVMAGNGTTPRHKIARDVYEGLRWHGWIHECAPGQYRLSELGQRALDGYRAQKRAG